ncbi:hypothetical protein WR25_03188, partial [Diploscapter pachys]
DGPISSNCDVLKSCKGNLTFVNNQFYSMRQEMNWLCPPNSKYASMFSSIIFVGVFFGTITWGTIGDLIGRKPATIASLTISMSANLYIGFAPPKPLLLIFIRCIVGFGIGGAIVAGFTLVMEMLLPHQRMPLRTLFNWGYGRLLLTLICMWFPDWRQSVLVCTLVAMPSIFIVLFVFPESPTWLHSKGRLREMEATERYMAKIGGVEYVPTKRNELEHSKTLCQVIRTRGLFRRLAVLWCMWFVSSFCSYATDFYSNTISGDLYVNQILFAIFIIISKKVLLVIDTIFPNFKRRTLHQGSWIIVIMLFLGLTIMKISDYSGVVFLTFNLLGTVFMELAWDANQLCVIESMETSCRSSATGSCSLIARVGGILAPFLAHLAYVWPPLVYAFVVVMGTGILIISYLFLVETKGVNLDKVHIDEDPTEETRMVTDTKMIKEDIPEPNLNETELEQFIFTLGGYGEYFDREYYTRRTRFSTMLAEINYDLLDRGVYLNKFYAFILLIVASITLLFTMLVILDRSHKTFNQGPI